MQKDVHKVIEDVGVDTLQVRRRDAPPWKRRGRGALGLARRMLKSKQAKAAGEMELMKDRFAPTTHKTRLARISTLKKLVESAKIPLLPVTVDGMNTVAAALKAGGYRTGISYLTIWESLHREAGHSWTPDLVQTKLWARKSMERGLGPNRHAATIILEKLVSQQVPSDGLDMILIGSLWMLRGAELAGLLIEQAHVTDAEDEATFILGAHKTNSEAHKCERKLRCSCKRPGTEEFNDLGVHVCPVHATLRVLQKRKAEKATDKEPLFPSRSGKAMSPELARERIRLACRDKALSEHSLRRMGAQFYARRGIQLPVIQFIGRWGSATVERYVAEALAGRAEWAPILAAAELDLSEVVGNGLHTMGPSIGAIAGVVSKLVASEVKKIKITESTATRKARRKAPVLEPIVEAPVTEVPEQKVIVEEPACAVVPEVPVCIEERRPARSYIRSTRTGVGHVVRFSGIGLHLSQWETECGWKFGKARQEACDLDAVSCTRCKLVTRV